MRFISVIFASSALALSAPAFAQAATPAAPAAAITPGMQVVDATGAAVGTVGAIQGDNLLIKTDKHETLVPKASFTVNNGKLLFGMTQAQLNAEIEKNQAAAQAALTAGATVKDLDGVEIGKIDSVSATGVVIALPSGQKIQVGTNAVRGNKDGTVTAGVRAAQLQAQLQAKPASPATPAKPATSATPAKPRK
jgi:hypothetical protein